MGLGAGVLSVNTRPDLIDEVVVVKGDAAWDRMRLFVSEDEYAIGPACGANLLVCEQIASMESGLNILTLFFDSAWKYESRWDGIYPEYTEVK